MTARRSRLRSFLDFRASAALSERIAGLEDDLEEIRRGRATAEAVEAQPPSAAALAQDIERLARADARWRSRLLDHVRGLAPYAAVNIEGTLYFFETRDPTGAEMFTKPQARLEHIHLRRALRLLDEAGIPARRDTFVDVGAHIGTTSLFAIRHARFSHVVAIEPSWANVRTLRLSVLANGLDDAVTIVQAAVSDSVGAANLSVSGLGSEYHHLVGSDGAAGVTERVETTTLDKLVGDGTIDPERASLVWLDIEGDEGRALSAASLVLDRAIPLVAEMCGEKIARTGGLAPLQAAVGESYTHFADLRRAPAEGFRPLVELPSIAEVYERRCTDVLIARLPNP